MSNRDAPAGFRVTGHVAGGESSRLSQYHIADALAADLFRGDLVIPVNTSKNITTPAAATNRVIGVFDGVYYADVNGDPQFRPRWLTGTTIKAGSTADANVYDDPKDLFEVQASGDFQPADIGALANPVLGAGNSLTGQSGQELDSASIGTGAVLKIMDISRKVDNGFGTNAKVIVALALHYLGGAMTTI